VCTYVYVYVCLCVRLSVCTYLCYLTLLQSLISRVVSAHNTNIIIATSYHPSLYGLFLLKDYIMQS